MAQPVPQRRNLEDVGEFSVSGQTGDFIFREADTNADMYIGLDGDDYFVREKAGTRNGTFLNGTKPKPGADALLTDGDQLRFAAVAVRFQHR